MPNYSYTVLNKKGEKLTGAIEANDLGGARENLNKLGFSIVAIEKAPEDSKNSKGIKTFEFEGIDEEGKSVEGTIKSQDKTSAYKKLKTEYGLEVKYLIDSSLDENQKIKERNKGVSDLEVILRKESREIKEKESKYAFVEHKEEHEKKLREKTEFVIKRLETFMKEYASAIEPQKFETLKKEKDKLLRIKSSKNTEYIKTTTEEILQLIQEEEFFVKGKISEERKTHIKVEAKKIMEELNISKGKEIKRTEIVNNLQKWNQDHFHDREDLKFHEKIIKKITELIIELLNEDPKVTALKKRLSAINKQLFDYIKLYIKEKSKSNKVDIKKSIKLIYAKRKQIKAELSGLRNGLKEELKRANPKSPSTFSENIVGFTGWLLTFYLVYYFISIYITTKDLGLTSIPKGFHVYDSVTFKYLIIIIFFLHISFSLKRSFFKESILASFIIFPISIISGILILFNL
jgi:hypothetical protein